jgi:hypothetical protein
MRRGKWINGLLALAILGFLYWLVLHTGSKPASPPPPAIRPPPPPQAIAPTAAESLLAGYADPATEPIDDLRKLHRVVTGYFSVVKDSSKNPIGGNADLAAALRGENPNREIFLPADHPLFSADGLLLDRWNIPLIVHPEAWRELELRSAGPDKIPYTADDLILLPNGHQPR